VTQAIATVKGIGQLLGLAAADDNQLEVVMNQQFAKVETQLETLLSAVLADSQLQSLRDTEAMIAPATTASSQARDWGSRP